MKMKPIKVNLSHPDNYGGNRDLTQIKYIVIHYTANDGDTDENNGKYFHNNVVKASAHYFVDSDSITVSVPDNMVAYSVGDKKYPNTNVTGGGKYYGMCNNKNSISIELTDDRKDGKIYPSQQTIENAVELTKHLMKKYKIPITNVIRHFDVSGKPCPAYWTDDYTWEQEFKSKLESEEKEIVTYEQFKSFMDIYLSERAKRPPMDFSEPYRAIAERDGIMKGDGQNMNYQSFVTKEECLAFIYRAFDKYK